MMHACMFPGWTLDSSNQVWWQVHLPNELSYWSENYSSKFLSLKFWDYNIITSFPLSPASLLTLPQAPSCCLSNSWTFSLIVVTYVHAWCVCVYVCVFEYINTVYHYIIVCICFDAMYSIYTAQRDKIQNLRPNSSEFKVIVHNLVGFCHKITMKEECYTVVRCLPYNVGSSELSY